MIYLGTNFLWNKLKMVVEKKKKKKNPPETN